MIFMQHLNLKNNEPLINRNARYVCVSKPPVQLIGISRHSDEIRKLINKASKSNASVIIRGPSGSGKEVVAQLLHQCSHRSSNPFIAINCAAIPRELLESEIFGHDAGAFTGAKYLKRGRFELADRGTLFLDEVGDMPSDMQVKLLRILDTQIVERVGSNVGIPVDVRLVAATNVDLEEAITNGKFREDLFYRLNVVEIKLAPLSERRDDIPLLIEHFTMQVADASRHVRFTAAATSWLSEQNWRGNVRELRNFVERVVAFHAGEEIDCELAQRLMTPERRPVDGWIAQSLAYPQRIRVAHKDAPINLKALLDQFEQSHIEQALCHADGAVAESARLLGLRRTTLIEKMRRLQIARPNIR